MFKKITEDAILPIRATKYSCAFDVCANEDMTINAGETRMIGTGVALDIKQFAKTFFGEFIKDEVMEQFYIELHPRSSMRLKGLIVGVGLIDIDYADEIKMVIHKPFTAREVWDIVNMAFIRFIGGDIDKYQYEQGYKIEKGDRIGQLVLKRHFGYLLPTEYTKDAERNGGFGSTGN